MKPEDRDRVTVKGEDGDGYFRSEQMSLIQLYIPFEAGHDCLSELGLLGLVEFRDVSIQVAWPTWAIKP